MEDPLSCSLTSTSLTPRSGRKLLTTLKRREDVIYAQGKVLLSEGDTASAQKLFASLSPGFENTSEYKCNITCYDSLCKKGIVLRKGAKAVYDALTTSLYGDDAEGEASTFSVRLQMYANLLFEKGYSSRFILTCTEREAHVLCDDARFLEGHRASFVRFSKGNTPIWEKASTSFVSCLEKCIFPLFKAAGKMRDGEGKGVEQGGKEEEEEEEGEEPTSF